MYGITFRNRTLSINIKLSKIPSEMFSKNCLCYSKQLKKLVPFKISNKPNTLYYETSKAIIFKINRKDKDFRRTYKLEPLIESYSNKAKTETILNYL